MYDSVMIIPKYMYYFTDILVYMSRGIYRFTVYMMSFYFQCKHFSCPLFGPKENRVPNLD